MLAQLQRPDVGGDRPAVGGRDPRGVGVHRPVAAGHHVKEVADRVRAQLFAVNTTEADETALDDHPPAVARSPWQGVQ